MPSAIVIKQVEGKPGKVWYPLEKITIPTPDPSQSQVRLTASPLPRRYSSNCKSGRCNPHSSCPKPPRPLHPPTSLPRHHVRRPPPRRRRRYRHIHRLHALGQKMAQQARSPKPRNGLERLTRWTRASEGVCDHGRHEVESCWYTG